MGLGKGLSVLGNQGRASPLEVQYFGPQNTSFTLFTIRELEGNFVQRKAFKEGPPNYLDLG